MGISIRHQTRGNKGRDGGKMGAKCCTMCGSSAAKNDFDDVAVRDNDKTKKGGSKNTSANIPKVDAGNTGTSSNKPDDTTPTNWYAVPITRSRFKTMTMNAKAYPDPEAAQNNANIIPMDPLLIPRSSSYNHSATPSPETYSSLTAHQDTSSADKVNKESESLKNKQDGPTMAVIGVTETPEGMNLVFNAPSDAENTNSTAVSSPGDAPKKETTTTGNAKLGVKTDDGLTRTRSGRRVKPPQ